MINVEMIKLMDLTLIQHGWAAVQWAVGSREGAKQKPKP